MSSSSQSANSPSPDSTFTAVVAMASNRVIGKDGALPWKLPGELKWFKSVTLGHPIVMGRKTYDSIGKALPGRRNIVLSRTLQPGDLPDAEVVNSVQALDQLDLEGEVMIIGGTRIFELLLDRTSKIYLTFVHHPYQGDTYFPQFESDFPDMEVLREHEEYQIREYRRES